MRSRKSRVPVLASLFSVIAILVMAGAVVACDVSQLHIVAGTCSIQNGAATRTWQLQNTEGGYSSVWSTDTSFPDANIFSGNAVVAGGEQP